MYRQAIAALLFAPIALAQQTPMVGMEVDSPRQLPTLVVGDLRAALATPGSWTPGEWGQVALGTLLLVGVSAAMDRPVDRAFRRLDPVPYEPWAKRLDTLGGVGTVGIAGGAYLGGLLLDQPRVRAFGADAAMSMLVAQLTVTLPSRPSSGAPVPWMMPVPNISSSCMEASPSRRVT